MAEQIKIDDTYTYEFDAGKVNILRHDLPWVSTEYGWGGSDASGPLTAAKAWIAAANEILDLRATIGSLTQQIEADADVIFMQQDQIEKLNRVNTHLESRTIDIPEGRS